MFLIGVMLMGIGFVYMRKPNLFRRGIWLRTSVAIRLLSEENYIKYMKGVGAVCIVIGPRALAGLRPHAHAIVNYSVGR
jgi:hypothetical protein